MSFGLCNAPGTYASMMNLVLRGLTWKTVLAFLDDILVLGSDFQSHLNNLRHVFERFRKYQLKLKPQKCVLFTKTVEFLGRKVSADGLEIGNQHVKPVQDWVRPTSTRHVERFLGFANYHRSFIKDFAKISGPLYEITGKTKFQWKEPQQQAFDRLKALLLSAPVLALPNKTDYYILDTDASDKAIGAELIQVQNGEERVIAYGSFILTPEQRRYCTTRKELLAIIRFTRQFKHYLLGRQFTVRTDHSSLTWLLGFKKPQGQLARWMEELSQYDMVIKHRPGKNHGNADGLSRIVEDQAGCPNYLSGIELKNLPCRGCKYCQKAHEAWTKFLQDVDEAVPLTKKKIIYGQQIDVSIAMIRLFGGEVLDDPSQDFNITSGSDIQEDNTNLKIVISEESVQIITISEDDGIVFQGFTTDDIGQAQGEDPDLRLILNFLKNQVEPEVNALFLSSPGAKSYWINKQMFFLDKHGVLRNTPKKDGARTRLAVPVKLRETVMELCHELPSAGHKGTERTLSKIKDKFHWYNMSRDIRTFVLTCEVCSKHKKPTRNARCHMTPYHAGAPMERVHLDFMGPLPKTKKGNEYVLMMVNQFTKWTECIPLPSQTAEITAQAAINEFVARFGYPFQIFTDQGRNFESALFKAVCDLLQIHKARTTPYRPSVNGQVERQNRSLMDAERCFVDNSQENWDEHLSQLAGAMRSCINRSTGFTPHMLMLGREANQPADLMLGEGQEKIYSGNDEYVMGLENAIKNAHEVARKTLNSTQKKMKRDYDVKILEKQ